MKSKMIEDHVYLILFLQNIFTSTEKISILSEKLLNSFLPVLVQV